MSEQTQQPTEKIYYDPISIAQRTKQKLHLVDNSDKAAMLAHIVKSNKDMHTVVIVKTKRSADALSSYLAKQDITATAVHGSKRAEENETIVKSFNQGELSVMLTTDMILQSLELNDITHIISYDLPTEPEYYLSRMACLKEQGESIAFVSEDQAIELLDIERVMRHQIDEEEVVGFVAVSESETIETPKRIKDQKKKPRHRKQKRKVTNKETDTVPSKNEHIDNQV